MRPTMVWLHGAIWVGAALTLAAWSVAAWLIVAAARHGAGAVERWSAWAAAQPWGRWLDAWLPGWQGLLQAAADLMHALLGWLNASAPWWPWLLWAVGVAALLMLASVASLVVVLLTPARDAARSAPRS
jgi:hypothetical protein